MYNDTRDDIIRYHSWMKTNGALALPIYIAGALATHYMEPSSDLEANIENIIEVLKFLPAGLAVIAAVGNMHSRFRGQEETRYGLNGPRPRPPVVTAGHH